MENSIDNNTVKKSYFNMLATLKTAGKVEGKYLACILKWGIQLGVNVDDLQKFEKDPATVPANKAEKLETLYHLVHMIYLDNIVEDIELEAATSYAERLGFKQGLVGELFKSIATLSSDEVSSKGIQKEVEDFLKLENA